MKTLNRIFHALFASLLILSACAPAPIAVTSETQTPEPPATIVPSPTLRPEVNVALNKPVRVSASWVVDPPEKAVNGNPNDWWGAGGPVPQWIEVELQGIYSVSKIRVINEGPTGYASYQVFGRGPDNENRLLHVFEGNKSNNQTLEFSPETAWEDISTIRIEINNGSGWVGFREVQVFSRDESKPLPASAEDAVPSFLSRVDTKTLEPITSDNAIFIKQLAMLGRGPINQLVWSPDGNTLAAAGALGVWLYDPAALDSPPRLLEGHTRDVLSTAFSPDGKMVWSGSQDGTVKQWDPVKGDLKRTTSLWADFSYEVGDQKRDSEVWSLAFSSDGKLLAAGSFDGTLRLWDLTTGRERAVLKRTGGLVFSLAFSPDGSLLASSGYDGALLLWDVATGSQVETLSGHEGWVSSLTFSPDGKTLATGGSDTTIRLWDVETGAELSQLEGHENEVINLTFSPDGKTLASNSSDGTIRFWDVDTGGQRPVVVQVYGVASMAFSPDGATLATSTGFGFLQLWDTATGSQSALLPIHTSPVASVAFSPDNRMLAAGSEDGFVRIWDVETNELQGILLGHSFGVTGVAFSPDGKLLASSSFDGTVILWDMNTGESNAVLEGHESYVRCVAFSPDGKLVASGGTDTTVRLWDVATGEESAVLTGHTGEVQSVAFSPDGLWLLSASVDKTLRIWEVATGKEVGALLGNLSSALDAVFSPDSALIASVGGDHSLRVFDWELASGEAVAKDQFPSIGHPGWVMSVTFSPDGQTVASANLSSTSFWVAPGEVHLYSAETGYPFALLRGHTKRVTSIAFSSDGKLLASGSADGSVRLWGTQQKGFSTASKTVIATPTPAPVPEVWHRLNPDRSNPAPEHEVLNCKQNNGWNCSFNKQAEPELGFEDQPDSTIGNFTGQDVTADWVCPSGFPSEICDNIQFVASGVMSLDLSEGNELAVNQDLIVTNRAGEQILFAYWTEQGFYCPWFEDFDVALGANSFPTPFNGQDWPTMDCNQSPPTVQTPAPKPDDVDPFLGEWTATDPHDGSNIMLTVTRSDDGNYSITLIDDGSTGCGLDSAGKPKVGIEIVFTATALGSTLYADSTSVTCLSTPTSTLNVQVHQNFSYREATDTLWDDANRTDWKRK